MFATSSASSPTHSLRARRPRLESLEQRLVPSTVTWDGGGATPNWSDRFNWASDVAPLSGDDLVFPSGAAQRTSFNNFPSGTAFHSLTFSGAGYSISGGSLNVLNLGGGGLINSAGSGTNRYNGPIQLAAVREIAVESGGALELGGVISGSGGLTKTGGGRLTLNGSQINTFTGPATVQGGSLFLDKGTDTFSVRAIQTSLIIDASLADVTVQTLRPDQLRLVNVTLTSGNGVARLMLGGSELIGGLDMTGGEVSATTTAPPDTQLSPLDNLTARPSTGTIPRPASITVHLELTVTGNEITVSPAPGFPDVSGLVVRDMGGVEPTKEGTGVMEFNGEGRFINTILESGTLLVNGVLTATPLAVRPDTTVGGNGNISLAEFTQDPVASTLDNGSPFNFNSTATVWKPLFRQGFSGGALVALPSVESGSVATATWRFTDLPSGPYRVYATWTGGLNHTTRAPFVILDGNALRGTAFVDQERSPAGGPVLGSTTFQQIGGTVNVTSRTLVVGLSNVVSSESDGALVVADAIRIERLAGTFSPGGLGTRAVGSMVVGDIAFPVGSAYRVDLASVAPGINAVDVLGVLLDRPSRTNLKGVLTLASPSFTPPIPGTAYRIITLDGQSTNPDGPVRFENAPTDRTPVELVSGGARHTFTVDYAAGDGNDVDLIYQNTATQARNLRLSRDVIREGDRVVLRGALTDPNRGDALTLRVAWGDGTTQTFNGLGTRPFHLGHRYLTSSRPGSPYVVHVTWSDQLGAGNSSDLHLSVTNVPPRVLLGRTNGPRRGGLLRLTARILDPGADTLTAAVDYGDGGGVQAVPVQPGKRLLLAHRYALPGRHRVTVTVADDDGGRSTRSLFVGRRG